MELIKVVNTLVEDRIRTKNSEVAYNNKRLTYRKLYVLDGGNDMLSEESYNNLMENIYVMGNKANYDWLMESMEQLKKGQISTHNLVEVDADE